MRWCERTSQNLRAHGGKEHAPNPMPRVLPFPRLLTQADVIRHLTRVRFDHARAMGWLKPRSIIRGKRGRALETYSLEDVRRVEDKFLEDVK